MYIYMGMSENGVHLQIGILLVWEIMSILQY